MKNLEKVLITIRGPMASGKTTLFQKLAECLPLENLVSIDREKYKNPLKQAQSKIKSEQIGFSLCKKAMESGYPILAQEYHPDFFKDLASDYGYMVISFHLFCSLDELIKRNELRVKKYKAAPAKVAYWFKTSKPTKKCHVIDTEVQSLDQAMMSILRIIRNHLTNGS